MGAIMNNHTPVRRSLLRRRTTRWQTIFPYHWDADEFVSRRELLKLAVMASGALFAATAGVVGLDYVNPRKEEGSLHAIVQASEVPEGSVHYFQYPTTDEQAILLHLPDGTFAAYSGRCTHLSCAVYYHQKREELVCPCHEGAFNPQTGDPTAGPPQRPLPKIAIRQDGEMLYAVEERPQ
jgi:Rieske Fe-S protein